MQDGGRERDSKKGVKNGRKRRVRKSQRFPPLLRPSQLKQQAGARGRQREGGTLSGLRDRQVPAGNTKALCSLELGPVRGKVAVDTLQTQPHSRSAVKSLQVVGICCMWTCSLVDHCAGCCRNRRSSSEKQHQKQRNKTKLTNMIFSSHSISSLSKRKQNGQ